MMIYLIIGLSSAIIIAIVYRSVPYIRYAYPTAKAESIGNPFLTSRSLDQLLEVRSLNSFKSMINAHKDFEVEGEDAEEIQRSLDQHMLDVIQTLKKECPKDDREFFDGFLEYLDGYGFKAFLISKLENKEAEIRLLSDNFRRVAGLIRGSDPDKIPGILKRFGIDVSGDLNPVEIDVGISKYVLKRLKEARVSRVSRSAKDEFVDRLVDIENVRNILKAKIYGFGNCEGLFLGEGKEIAEWRFRDICRSRDLEGLISGLEGTSYHEIIKKGYDDSKRYGNIQLLEKSLDEILLKEAKDLSIKNFPFLGTLIKFLVSRYFELRNLKIIAKGIEEGLSKDRIKPLLLVGG